MLASLRIRNLALVPDLSLEWQPGLNVITGETGAGKSVILGAIQLAIGQRADRSAIRSGADLCSVEAVFDAETCRAAVEQVLADAGLDPCEAGALVIRRSVSASGVNRQFVNGSPSTLATLSGLGEWLVDLHGPHDHQSLLQPSRQLDILDAFGGHRSIRNSFASAVQRRDVVRRQLDDIEADPSAVERQRDLLQHQVHEIEAARLQPGEEETLAAEHARAMHATRLLELSRSILGALVEDDDSIAQRLSLVGRSLQEMARLDSSAKEAVQFHQQAEGSLHDLRRRVERQATAMDMDPERLAVVSERLDLLQSLRRKYGNSIPDILQFASRAATELAAIEGRHEKAASLRGEQAAIEEELADLGSRLRTARHAAAPRLASAVGRELAGLGFARPELQVSLRPAPGHDAPASAAPSGLDACEFLFAPNPGEPPLPLRSIASSGELARVMLALKTVLAAEDEVPVLVFDEVDANVGGETAHAVGEKLRRIAQDHQVLCISHLAQVAAHADAHYVVTKEIREGRTESQVRRLDDAGRIAELGRMLGGGPAAQRHAAEILNSARSKRP